MVRYGGIKESWDGTIIPDLPIGDIYKCKKCGKQIIEHIWIGHGWRGHVESYGGVVNGISGLTHCSENNCEINHRNECDGKLILIRKGKDSQTAIQQKEEIHGMIAEIFSKNK